MGQTINTDVIDKKYNKMRKNRIGRKSLLLFIFLQVAKLKKRV